MGILKPKKPETVAPPKVEDPIEMPSQGSPEFKSAARIRQREDERTRKGRDASNLSGGGRSQPVYSRSRLG